MKGWKISTLVLTVLLLLVVGGSFLRSAAADKEKQPAMKRALSALVEAKNALENATHDKGGHRAKALELTKEAIVQVEKGIAFDNKN